MPPLDNLIDLQPGLEIEAEREIIASLKANRIDPKLLYVTPRQSDLWREVFLRHSPIHSNPEFARIYGEAFAKIADSSSPTALHLIGLGCGTGKKERDLAARLQSAGVEVRFSAIDVSRELVLESMRNLHAEGARLERSLVGDLAATGKLSAWLDRHAAETRRLVTLFGLVPNLPPEVTVRLIRAVLRPGDTLLVSAHLAPVSDSVDLATALRRVLPQYDNPETLAWLSAGLEQWEIADWVQPPRMRIGEIGGIPAFIAEARWKSSHPFERSGQSFSPDPARPLQVFHSLRYTPALFEQSLLSLGLTVERLALTACREEAIWSVKANLI